MFVHELVSQGKPDAIAVIDHERRITYINSMRRAYARVTA